MMSELKQGTLYLIRHKEEKWEHFEGTFKEYIYTHLGYNNVLYPKFDNVIRYYMIDPTNKHDYYIPDKPPHMAIFLDFKNITFYDAEKVKNGKKAIQNRERRTVNMILRRLIGDEHFEW
jgi:hypothetical protein